MAASPMGLLWGRLAWLLRLSTTLRGGVALVGAVARVLLLLPGLHDALLVSSRPYRAPSASLGGRMERCACLVDRHGAADWVVNSTFTGTAPERPTLRRYRP